MLVPLISVSLISMNAGFKRSALDGMFWKHRTLSKSSYAGDPFIVINDPRISLFLPIWEHALHATSYRTFHVVLLHSPRSVAESLRQAHLTVHQYDAWPQPRGHLIWLRYALSAVQGTRSKSRCLLIYNDLLANWRKVAETVAQSAGLIWPRMVPAIERELDASFGSAEYAIDADSEIAGPLPSPPTVRFAELANALYFLLVHSGDDAAQVDAIAKSRAARLDSVRDIVAAAESLIPALSALHSAHQDLHQRYDLSLVAEAHYQSTIQQLWNTLNRANQEKATLRQELSFSGERVAQLERAIPPLKEQIVELRGQIVEFVTDRDARILERDSVIRERDQLIRQRDQIVLERDEIIRERDRVLIERDDVIRERDRVILQRDDVIRQRDQMMLEREGMLRENAALQNENSGLRQATALAEQHLNGMYTSLSWRLTAPLRFITGLLGRT